MVESSAPPAHDGRRPSPNLIAGLVLVLALCGVILWQKPWADVPPPANPSAQDASSQLIAQIHDLRDASSKKQFFAAAGETKAARQWASRTWANLKALGVANPSLRYVSGGQSGVRKDGTEGRVEVSWRPGEASGLKQEKTAEATVTFLFDRAKGGSYAIVGTRQADEPLPLWLVGTLDVQHVSGSTLITIDGGNPSQPMATFVGVARTAVRKVLSGGEGTLVVISPATRSETAELLGQPEQDIKQIAAVTTTLDGSGSRKAATAIVLNPKLFETMDARAAQVVMTHEAVHQETLATGAKSDPWVVEGFADFVALHDDKEPLSVSAGQILTQVAKDGVPEHLPDAGDFNASHHGLGATYESAWMIFRMLAERHSDSQIVDFYDAVLAGSSTDDAARKHLGESVAQITKQWQSYLLKSASTVS